MCVCAARDPPGLMILARPKQKPTSPHIEIIAYIAEYIATSPTLWLRASSATCCTCMVSFHAAIFVQSTHFNSLQNMYICVHSVRDKNMCTDIHQICWMDGEASRSNVHIIDPRLRRTARQTLIVGHVCERASTRSEVYK